MPNAPKPRPTVLVVDDDPDFLDSLKLVLEIAGFAVVPAENGVRGLQAFRNRAPSVTLIDVMMPKLGGIEAARQMRRERPDAKIIVMSGSPGLGKVELSATARELGAVAALAKPFDPEVLMTMLRELVSK